MPATTLRWRSRVQMLFLFVFTLFSAVAFGETPKAKDLTAEQAEAMHRNMIQMQRNMQPYEQRLKRTETPKKGKDDKKQRGRDARKL